MSRSNVIGALKLLTNNMSNETLALTDVTLQLLKQKHPELARGKKSPYSELFWSAFSRIFPHSDWIRGDLEYLSVLSPNTGKSGKNADQNNSEYGIFLRSVD